ncbi:MAG: PorV/PorQ family protein [Elusimicrobiota bacterium]
MKRFLDSIKKAITGRCAVFPAAILAFALAPAFAGGPGSAGMQALKTEMSPRAAGMGGVFAAIADDIYAMDYNPAGLGQLYIPEASAMYLSGFDDSTLNHISIGMPLPFMGLAGLARPGFGISLMLADAGSFDYNYIRGDGSVFKKSYDAQKDLALAFGYGEKVYSGEVNLEGYNAKIEQYLGLNMKYIRSTMLEDKNPPSTVAFDGGWLMLEPKLGLSLGVSLANYGPGLKYGAEITKLPSILRMGISYQRPTVLDQSVLLAVEGDFYMAEAMKSLRFGLEYHFEKIFNLRLGYKAAEDNKGLTMGLGLRHDGMSLDFSGGLGNEVYNATQLAFSYKFSGIAIKEYRKRVNYRDPEPQKTAPVPVKPRQERKPTRVAPEKKKDSDFFWIH